VIVAEFKIRRGLQIALCAKSMTMWRCLKPRDHFFRTGGVCHDKEEVDLYEMKKNLPLVVMGEILTFKMDRSDLTI
jgi:hypothetical protein